MPDEHSPVQHIEITKGGDMSQKIQLLCSSIGIVAAIAGAVVVLPQAAVADKDQPLDQRKAVYAPWSPDQMAQRRTEQGLIGPGTTRPVPGIALILVALLLGIVLVFGRWVFARTAQQNLAAG